MVNQQFKAWLRTACALLGVAGVLVLGACGGGNGAPNNPYEPVPPTIPSPSILPSAITVYPGTPATLTISGGVAPFRLFSSDSNALPIVGTTSGDTVVLAANQVSATTTVNVTVQDSRGLTSFPASVTVNPAPLIASGITITANPNPACASTDGNLCSGGTGTAVVQVTGNGGVGIQGRSVRYDVVQGSFSIVSTNPANPLVQTLTTITDSKGNATVVLSVPADTPTQTGIIRATDLTSGNQVTATFTILQVTTGGQVLSVLPQGTTTITGPDTAHCSSGVSVTNYIFGGTPPYQVGTNFPGAVTITGVPVTKSGGAFVTTTNGTCFVNLTYVITDATGRTIPAGNYPTVTNQLGTVTPTPPATTLVVTPGAIAKVNCVPANTFQFIGTGGVTPYSAVVSSSTSSTTPSLSPQTGVTQGQAITVSGLTSPSNTIVTLFDSSSPRQSATVSIDCSGTGTPPVVSPLAVTPSNYNFTLVPPAGPGTCVNQTANFAVTGGTAPYTVFFTTPRPGAIISPTTLSASGQGFAVTGLTDGVLTTNITVQDAASPPLQQVVTITCPTPSTGNPIAVTPNTYTYVGELACSTSASLFTINGGLPPYTVFFPVPGTAGTITPTQVPGGSPPNNQFVVSGMPGTPLPRTTQVTIRDSSSIAQTSTVTIECRAP